MGRFYFVVSVFLMLNVLVFLNAAPVNEKEESKEVIIPDKANEDNEIALPKEEDGSGEGSGEEPEQQFIPVPDKVQENIEEVAEEDEDEDDNDINEEKTNYEDFGIDVDSFEKNKNAVVDEDSVEYDCDLDFNTARQLATNIDNPSAIADYIISTNDIESFVCVVQILLDDGLVSKDEADFLEEEVSNELQRKLYDDVRYFNVEPYSDEVEEVEEEEEVSDGVLYPDIDDVIAGDMDELLYDLAETLYRQPESEKATAERALIQFAGIIAREVVLGNLSPEEGEAYLDILGQLPFGEVLEQEENEMFLPEVLEESEFEEMNDDNGDEGDDGDDDEEDEIEEIVYDDGNGDEEETEVEEEIVEGDNKGEYDNEVIDDLEEELVNSAKNQGSSKVQDTFYPEDGKFATFPEYKENYLDDIREDIVWLQDYGLLPTGEEANEEEAEKEELNFDVDLDDILDNYVNDGKLSDDDAAGIRNLLGN